MENALNKKVTFKSLLKYTFPSVIMMVFFSLYTIVDGIFISRFIGSDALSSANIVYPVISILIGIGIMFATGGSAIVAKYMGENKNKEARESFSLITLTALIVGCIIAIISILFIKDIIYMLGSTENLYKHCYAYLFTMLIFTPCIILKMFFDYFLITAGAANLGLISSTAGGVVNIILDYIFIVKLNMGIEGAALGTCIGYALPSLIGILYFCKKSNMLHFVKPKVNLRIIKDSCINGSSEMVTQLSSAVTTFLYNVTMLKFLGEDGVAAITIILYVSFLLNAAYLGFTSGVSPRISYNYGSQDEGQLEKLIKYSYLTVIIFGVITFIISRFSSEFLVATFAAKGTTLFDITLRGFIIFSFSFIVSGINIFTSGMFTAFSDGKTSALLSLLRTLILFVIGIVTLPYILGVDGVWLVVPFVEFTTLIFSFGFLYKYRNKYMYANLFNRCTN